MSTVSITTLKAEALRASGTLHPDPARIIDPLFQGSPFFDGRDLVQVKYEMLRRVTREHSAVQAAATAFGFSRVTWYQVKVQYDAQGLMGLLPRRRGPRPDPPKTVSDDTPVRLAEIVQQYELLRQHTLMGEGPCCGWGLVRLLRWGMAAWIQAQLIPPTPDDARTSQTDSQNAPAIERDWVLALAAFVMSQNECREVGHG